MKKLTILVAVALAVGLLVPSSSGAASLSEEKKLMASDAEAGDQFGMSVAVSGDIAVVGAYNEGAGGMGAGAAYVFSRNQGGTDNWGEVKKLTASDAQMKDYFGESVAVSGDIAVVGAYCEDAGGTEAGAAYVFSRNQGGTDNWGQVKKLTASDAQADDYFGISVAVSGDIAVVGARREDAGGSNAGASYVFSRNQGGTDNWGEVEKLTASDAQAGDYFGRSMAASGDTAVVGADGEGAGGSYAGAAYVFQAKAVGGIQGLPEMDGAPLQTDGSSGPGAEALACMVLAAGAVALVGGAWYARRRRQAS